MELVLASAPISHYGVIVNKLENNEYAMLATPTEDRSRVLTGLMNGLPTKSLYFHAISRKESLAGEYDQVPVRDEQLEQLERFVKQLPAVLIKPEEVKPIAADNFEALTEKFEKIIEDLSKKNDVLQQKIDEDREHYATLIKDMQARSDAAQAQNVDMMEKMQEQNAKLEEEIRKQSTEALKMQLEAQKNMSDQMAQMKADAAQRELEMMEKQHANQQRLEEEHRAEQKAHFDSFDKAMKQQNDNQQQQFFQLNAQLQKAQLDAANKGKGGGGAGEIIQGAVGGVGTIVKEGIIPMVGAFKKDKKET
jgi:flagellar biosynthesis GTPase FlhF